MHPLIVQSQFHAIVLHVVMAICFGPEWIGSFIQRPQKGAVRRAGTSASRIGNTRGVPGDSSLSCGDARV
ncbi:MAG: hypothetical protein ACTHMO_10175 [Rhodanobacteraceae bacterium]